MATADQSTKPWWNARRYTLAALWGTLAVAAIVIIVSVALRPAEITFSVSRASYGIPAAYKTYLNLTIVASSEQRRAAVKYESVFIDLKNSTSAAGMSTVHAQVDTKLPADYLPGPNSMSINASALVVGEEEVESFVYRKSGLTVVVTVQVRFKVWLLKTKLYDILVSCPNVHFLNETSKSTFNSVQCDG